MWCLVNVLLSQQNRACNPEQKDEALNLTFMKPPELQVDSSANSYLFCFFGMCLSSVTASWLCQVRAGKAERDLRAASVLQPPAVIAHQESRV